MSLEAQRKKAEEAEKKIEAYLNRKENEQKGKGS